MRQWVRECFLNTFPFTNPFQWNYFQGMFLCTVDLFNWLTSKLNDRAPEVIITHTHHESEILRYFPLKCFHTTYTRNLYPICNFICLKASDLSEALLNSFFLRFKKSINVSSHTLMRQFKALKSSIFQTINYSIFQTKWVTRTPLLGLWRLLQRIILCELYRDLIGPELY